MLHSDEEDIRSEAAHLTHSQSGPDMVSLKNISVDFLEKVLSSRISVLKHLPKKSRLPVARCLIEMFNHISSSPSNVLPYIKLLIFPKLVLFSHKRAGRAKRNQLNGEISKRLSLWNIGEFDTLLMAAMMHSPSPSSIKRCSTESSHARRAKVLISEGNFSKALQALVSEGLATLDEASFKKPVGKHPSADPTNLQKFLSIASDSIIFSEHEVTSIIKSFPKGSAAGNSLLRNELLVECMSVNNLMAAQSFISSNTSFLNILVSGKAPICLAPYLAGGAGTA